MSRNFCSRTICIFSDGAFIAQAPIQDLHPAVLARLGQEVEPLAGRNRYERRRLGAAARLPPQKHQPVEGEPLPGTTIEKIRLARVRSCIFVLASSYLHQAGNAAILNA